MMARFWGSLMAVALALPGMVAVAGMAAAQAPRPTLQDSFAIGTPGDGGLCEAQSQLSGPALDNIFDRGWSIVCRDAGMPVGQVFAFHRGGAAAADRLAKARADAVTCDADKQEAIADIGAVTVRRCQTVGGLPYRIVLVDHGRFTYVEQGLAGYQSALDLALRSVVTDRIVPGKVTIALLGGDDPTAFARLQARSYDPQVAMAEGYRRNNSGSYAEAAAFFDALGEQSAAAPAGEDPGKRTDRLNRTHESYINQALQLSNLGQFDEADALFAKALAVPTRDPVQIRLRRNFMAINRLNQRDYAGARTILDQPVEALEIASSDGNGGFTLTSDVAAAINSDSRGQIGVIRQDATLTPSERAAIIDAQALALRGISLRLDGDAGAARADLDRAIAAMLRIRGGRVTSITRLHAQLLAEIGLADEAQGKLDAAQGDFQQAVRLLELHYPATVALNSARAQYAAFLVRRGKRDEALALYRQIVATTAANQGDLAGVANQLQPYFAMLAEDIPAHPDRVDDLFLVSQMIVRPGAASTLEQLARAMSSGNDAGAALFRQSVSLGRDIERARITLAQLQTAPEPDPAAIAAANRTLDELQASQQGAITSLAAYPQFRAIDASAISLADLRATLRPGEAYYKLTEVGDSLYAIYADASGATGFRVAISSTQLAERVQTIRESISTTVNGVQATYPFDVEAARQLYVDLFQPVAGQLAGIRHLIFEPDGAMLSLPPGLLIADQQSVDRYLAKRDAPGGDDFDFRGINWLARGRGVSTALSARSFRATRAMPAAAGSREYLGFGENAPLSGVVQASYTRSGDAGADCRWSPRVWDRPIAASELRDAASALGDANASVVTGAAFSDTNILAREDLSQFHILHFATHGLVAAPRTGCPVEPALLTSFGGQGSDGLLDFSEIFRLKIDADLVILSACDTAAGASRVATLAAGLGNGGGTALDGLVRAFIGAGGRTVIASHWPAPDQFDATRRLFSGLFANPPDTPVEAAMESAELKLMDDAETSHPFYWAGFAVVGDGARPIISGTQAAK